MIEAYPLHWPLSVPRTPASERQRARFGTRDGARWGTKRLSVKQALDRVLSEVDKYTRAGQTYRVPPDSIVISTNIRTRQDGLPYSNAKEPDDPGVCVYFELDGFPVALPCDTFDRVADNIAAIAGHIEADRRQERYGVGNASQRYAGFKALPAAGESTGVNWWDILGVPMDTSAEAIKQAFRRKARETHPDHGGSVEAFGAVQEAYRQAITAVG